MKNEVKTHSAFQLSDVSITSSSGRSIAEEKKATVYKGLQAV